MGNSDYVRSDIRGRIQAYEKLREIWSSCKESIKQGAVSFPFGIDPEEGEDEIILVTCGVRIYIRFAHDFKVGFIEYGTFTPDESGIQEKRRRLPVATLTFDNLGNIEGHYTAGANQNDDWTFPALHLKTLSSILPKVVREYYWALDSTRRNETEYL
jgi:hypothetical protein